MGKFLEKLLTLSLILVMTISCISVAYSQNSSAKARQILEKTAEKYSTLLNEDGKGIKSIAAKMTIRGGGQMPMSGAGNVPLDVDADIEIYYASQSKDLYLSISGNLGNATIIASGKEKMTATIILPSMKQFAVVDMPESVMKETQKYNPQEPDNEIEKVWDEAILAYEGMYNMKLGRAHKITVKNKVTPEKGSVTVYILDGKWDPAGIEISDPEKGTLGIEFKKLELNGKIPDSQFVPKVAGYTKVETQQLLGTIMMQIMGAMMQGGGMQ